MLIMPILIIFLLSLAFIHYFIELLQRIIRNEDYKGIRIKCMITFPLMVASFAIYNLYLRIL